MSFEINWDKLLEDGDQLSETIRSFLDQRFKEMSLPSYLKSISVTSFDLGTIAPNIEIKRITDPFPEFYSDDEEDDEVDEPVISGHHGDAVGINNGPLSQLSDMTSTRSGAGSTISEPPAYQTDEEQITETNHPGAAPRVAPPALNSPLNSGFPNSTIYPPTIASSITTTNLHFPPSIQNSFISGIRSPFHPQWQNNPQIHVPSLFPVISRTNTSESLVDQNNQHENGGTSTSSSGGGSNRSSIPSLGATGLDPSANIHRTRPGQENDIQLYLQISYKGDIKVGIETTLLVNYPSPNFVSLPLKLNITGLEISSIAALAYIERKIHFSFICDLDADGNPVTISGHDRVEIIKDIKIESEIGDQEGNGPVLRNVGKLERFLLDRLRHLARDELAWPGWITLEI
jgi:distribution and morphology protein 12